MLIKQLKNILWGVRGDGSLLEGVNWPHEGELLFVERVAHVDYVEDHKNDQHYANVEHRHV